MSTRIKVIQKHLNSTQILQKHIFESICPQKLKHKTHFALKSNQGIFNLGWSQQDHKIGRAHV